MFWQIFKNFDFHFWLGLDLKLIFKIVKGYFPWGLQLADARRGCRVLNWIEGLWTNKPIIHLFPIILDGCFYSFKLSTKQRINLNSLLKYRFIDSWKPKKNYTSLVIPEGLKDRANKTISNNYHFIIQRKLTVILYIIFQYGSEQVLILANINGLWSHTEN